MDKKQGIVNIRGKEYQTVALRVHTFREQYPKHALLTEVLHRDAECVVLKATISDETGRVLATGHAEEYRKASEINKTSALENAETSAIGRALAAFGLGGTEFASADEVARAISGAKGQPPAGSGAAVKADAYSNLTPDWQAWVDVLATDMVNMAESSGPSAAKAHMDASAESEPAWDNEIKLALWSRLPSKVRTQIDAMEKKAA
jgi:hypothetical protein